MTKHYLPNSTTDKAALFTWRAAASPRDYWRTFGLTIAAMIFAALALRWVIAALVGV